MEVEVLSEVAAAVGPLDVAAVERDALLFGLEGVRRVRAWADHAEVVLAERLSVVSPLASAELASAARRSPRHGGAVLGRVATVAVVPALGAAMQAGALDGSHAHALGCALRGIAVKDRGALIERAPALVEDAVTRRMTPDAWSASLAVEVQRLDGDHGEQRGATAPRATRLRTWTERATGMWRLSGSFDAATGALLHGRLEAAMAALFTKTVPATAPDDPGERQDHLRALALLALTGGTRAKDRAPGSGTGSATSDDANVRRTSAVRGSGPRRPTATQSTNRDAGDAERELVADTSEALSGHATSSDVAADTARSDADAVRVGDPLRSPSDDSSRLSDPWADLLTRPSQFGRPEMIVVVNLSDLGPDGMPIVDFGLPLRPSWTSVAQLAQRSRIWPVVVDRGQVVAADGTLNLGRTARFANRAQRRALQGLYSTCAIPGCSVRFAHTRPHHIWAWEFGGPTDLDNLIPLCSRHHHAVHDDAWELSLGAQRELTIRLPDGTAMSTGPPSRSAA